MDDLRPGPGASLLVLLALLLYLLLTGARILSDRPMVDEAWFGSPALNLARHGSMHTSILESTGTFMEGLDRYTFWIMPAYPVALAGWFNVVEPSLTTMRLFSALFGAVVVLATFVMVSRLMSDQGTGALAAVLLAIDFAAVRGGALARMDSMCAAFGIGGLAVYLALRGRDVRAAFVAGHAPTAVSLLTHPNGVLYVFGLMLVALIWDRPRLRFPDLLLGALPYLLLFAAWGLYIANDPGLFRQQFGGNASGRFDGVLAPLHALAREINVRYLAGEHSVLRAVLLLPYLIGIAAACAVAPLRQHKGVQTLLALTLLFLLHQWLFEAVKLYFYVIHLTPLYMALFAIALRWWYREHVRWRAVAMAGAALLVSVHVAGTAFTVRRASYHNTFLPVVESVRANAGPQDLVMASAEMAFGLGFDANLVDDVRLGYDTGRRPDVVVLDRRYKEALAVQDRAPADHVHSLLEGYDRVFTLDDYEVFVRPREGIGEQATPARR
jgi:uncharacterized membrane protein